MTPRPVKSAARSSPAQRRQTPHALTASYVYYRDIHETDPDTTAAWTPAGVNGARIGPEVVT